MKEGTPEKSISDLIGYYKSVIDQIDLYIFQVTLEIIADIHSAELLLKDEVEFKKAKKRVQTAMNTAVKGKQKKESQNTKIKIKPFPVPETERDFYEEEVTKYNTPSAKFVIVPVDKYDLERFHAEGTMESRVAHQNILLNSILVYLMAIFEGFNKDLCKIVFYAFPQRITSNKTLQVSEIIKCGNWDGIMNRLIEGELIENAFPINIDSLGDYLKKHLCIDPAKFFKGWAKIRENKYRRNDIVHNSGRISKDYAEKFVAGDDSKINTNHLTDFNYVSNCAMSLKEYLEFFKENIPTMLRQKDDSNPQESVIPPKFFDCGD